MKTSTGIPKGLVPEYDFQRFARGLHVSLPAEVVSFDGESSVSVQPLGFQIDSNDDRHRYPVIENVPIATYRAGGFIVTFPIKPGDEGTVVFCDKNIDFLKNASFVNERYHYHELTDAIFFPGLVYTLNPVESWDADNVSIRNEENTARIMIDPDGNIILDTEAKILMNAKEGIEMTTEGEFSVMADAAINLSTNGDMSSDIGGKFKVSSTNMDLDSDLEIKSGGTIKSVSGDVVATTVSLKNHTHQYTDSVGSAATPTPRSTQSPTP